MSISTKYFITGPTKLESVREEIPAPSDGELTLKTLRTSICTSDLRYYFGQRPASVLASAYPLCPFHEAVAEVVNGSGFEKGERVIPVPNIPCYIRDPKKYPSKERACVSCRPGGAGEHYCVDGLFSSSNTDGFARELFNHPASCIVKVPTEIPNDIASFAEPLSVAYESVMQAGIDRYLGDNKVTIIGSGPVAYITAVTLRALGTEKNNLCVVGVYDEQLAPFKHLAETFNSRERSIKELQYQSSVAFECVGSNKAEFTIADAVETLKPGGTCVLVGLSDGDIPIKTRSLLKKNAHLVGIMRSPISHYPVVLDMMKTPLVRDKLYELLVEPFSADSDGIAAAFRAALDLKVCGKVAIDWNY